MKRCGMFLLFMGMSAAVFSQISSDIMLSYTVGNGIKLEYTSNSIIPFVAGVNFNKKLTRQKYNSVNLLATSGVRFNRSGYSFTGYLQEKAAFYISNRLSRWSDDTHSELIQHSINVPIGVELRINGKPALRPGNYSASVKFLLNNSFLISSSLEEYVHSFSEGGDKLQQNVNMKKYSKTYIPGMTVEIGLLKYINAGVTYQNISYAAAKDELTFDGRSASPFYGLISREGRFRDLSIYLGINIPTTLLSGKKKHAK